MTNISNMTYKLCLNTPGVCVGGANHFALKTFFHSCDSKSNTVNTDQNEQMLWPN